jgi:hypothetical protein
MDQYFFNFHELVDIAYILVGMKSMAIGLGFKSSHLIFHEGWRYVIVLCDYVRKRYGQY